MCFRHGGGSSRFTHGLQSVLRQERIERGKIRALERLPTLHGLLCLGAGGGARLFERFIGRHIPGIERVDLPICTTVDRQEGAHGGRTGGRRSRRS